MNIFRASLFASMATCALATQALAWDECDAILDKNLMSETQIVSQQSAAQSYKYSFCNKSYQEMKSSGSFDLGIKYKVFSLDAGKSDSSFQSWKQENCGNQSSAQSEDAYRFEAQRTLHPTVTAAWESCKLNRTGLMCFASPERDAGSFRLRVRWQAPGIGKAVVEDAQVEGGPPISLKKNDELLPGTRSMIVRRNDRKAGTTVVINARYNNDSVHSCEAYVPGDEDPKPPPQPAKHPLEGRWCYPPGTMTQSVAIAPQPFHPPARLFSQTNGKWTLRLSPNVGQQFPYPSIESVEVKELPSGNYEVSEISPEILSQNSIFAIDYWINAPYPAPTANPPFPMRITNKYTIAFSGNDEFKVTRVSSTNSKGGTMDYTNVYPLFRFTRCD